MDVSALLTLTHTLTQADNVLSISRVSYSMPMGLQRSDLSKIRALLAISRAHGKDITQFTITHKSLLILH